jgi:hypothetical protein
VFYDPKREPNELPRVLHLREKRFGVSFDAPDDSWLGIGPRKALNSVNWDWVNRDRRIELVVIAMGAAPVTVSDLALDALTDSYRNKGAAVTQMRSELSGRPCIHLVVDQKGAPPEDVFIQFRSDFAYSLTVRAPTRDADLLAKARAGLRIDTPTPP